MSTLRTALLFCAVASPALAGFATIDFSTEDDFLTPLVNGQEINATGPNAEFGNLISIAGVSGSRLAIFDTDPMGPNMGGGDPDLLVGLGNALIVQNTSLLTQSTTDVFDTPDDNIGGDFAIDMITPGELASIDLIDINNGGRTIITLTDQNGFQRVYNVPANWSNQAPTPNGYDTLSFLTTAPQEGEGPAGAATVTLDEAGYDQTAVARLEFRIFGSAGFDNLVIDSLVPSPGALALFGLSGVAMLRSRRD